MLAISNFLRFDEGIKPNEGAPNIIIFLGGNDRLKTITAHFGDISFPTGI